MEVVVEALHKMAGWFLVLNVPVPGRAHDQERERETESVCGEYALGETVLGRAVFSSYFSFLGKNYN